MSLSASGPEKAARRLGHYFPELFPSWKQVYLFRYQIEHQSFS